MWCESTTAATDTLVPTKVARPGKEEVVHEVAHYDRPVAGRVRPEKVVNDVDNNIAAKDVVRLLGTPESAQGVMPGD